MRHQLYAEAVSQTTRILTIGYGADEFDGFMNRLTPHGVTHLVDVRTNAYSRYQEDYRGEAFAARLSERGVKYVFMGDALGAKPTDPAVLTNGQTDYDKLKSAGFFLRGLDQLVQAARNADRLLCLMCGCGRPELCHRGRLISPLLTERGVVVNHILPDGGLIDETEMTLRRDKGQQALF